MTNGDDWISTLVLTLANLGKQHPSTPDPSQVEPFAHYFTNGSLDYQALDQRDGALTRREALTRFLLLSAVLDQGPDIRGLREWVRLTTHELYRREVRFLHKPLAFFEELGLAIDQLMEKHQSVSHLYAEQWAKLNRSRPERYNLFMDNARQVLGYAVFRWGVPLALAYILEKDRGEPSPTALLDYLEEHPSTEIMTQNLKDHPRYGLGKAIGDKAAHLFGKWLVSSYKLSRRGNETAWQGLSYEVPFDSNAGRVLWRTGYFLNWASEKDYERHKVLQPGQGKSGKTYIRVTNIRGMTLGDDRNLPPTLKEAYNEICTKHLMTHKHGPKKVEIQRIQHAYLLMHRLSSAGGLDAGHFDDGLMFVGTHYCYNHDEPSCPACPIRHLCAGYSDKQSGLINNYRT